MCTHTEAFACIQIHSQIEEHTSKHRFACPHIPHTDMLACVHRYTCVHRYVHTPICTHTETHRSSGACSQLYLHIIHRYPCTQTYTQAHTNTYIHMHVCTHICLHTHVSHACTLTYTCTHTDTHIDNIHTQMNMHVYSYTCIEICMDIHRFSLLPPLLLTIMYFSIYNVQHLAFFISQSVS